MPENTLTKITEKELKLLRLSPNKVLVEILNTNEDKTTKSGIIVGFNRNTQYGEGEGSHVADVADIRGKVYKVCDRLFFKKGHSETMPWKTKIEIKPGDEVFFDYLDGLNSDRLEVDGRLFYILHYSALYLALLGGTYYPLNGYCLFKRVKIEKSSRFDIRDDWDTSMGEVVVLGRANDGYENERMSDGIKLKIGSKVKFVPNFRPVFVERQEYMAELDDLYIRAQRRSVAIVY